MPRWIETFVGRSSKYCTLSAGRWTTWCARSSTTPSTATRSPSTPRTIAWFPGNLTSRRIIRRPPNRTIPGPPSPPPLLPTQPPPPPMPIHRLWRPSRFSSSNYFHFQTKKSPPIRRTSEITVRYNDNLPKCRMKQCL